jgi:hypothetical protein
MANPNHYSLELPDRCLHIIDKLWPCVENLHHPVNPDAGPLTTTFLLAMAMPIIILPIERIERHQQNEGYADDRHIEPEIERAVKAGMGTKLSNSSFFVPAAWSYVGWPDTSTNIARGLPLELSKQLSSQEAYARAASMPASQFCSVLRNALSHGGVAYLDANGRATPGGRAEMFCFVSGKYDEEGVLRSLNCLRIGEGEFRTFLRQWVKWLRDAGVTRLMAA